jgi:hypothetical protein
VLPYYTDGGISYDDPNNTMLELFAPPNPDKLGKDYLVRPYISTKRKNVTVACYLGKNFTIDKNKKQPYQWNVPNEPKEIRHVDFDKFASNKEEQVTLKIPMQVEFSYFTNQTFRSGYSNQRNLVMFTSRTDISKRKEPILDIFNDDSIPEMADFLKLNLPIRQIVKVDRASNAAHTNATFKTKGSYTATSYDQFEIDTLPKMEVLTGVAAQKHIETLLTKKDDEDDHGYIFEIDLT